ncbi:MAG: glycosyltransferase family 4 protein [Chthoniobacterales bacterium]
MSFARDLTIGFVRRGFSSSGGAEAYLKRLAAGVAGASRPAALFTGPEWPANEWSFGPIHRVAGSSASAFADELERAARGKCDVLFSLERIWRCDLYRAGDGVHLAWLERRKEFAGLAQKLSRVFNRKHAATLALEGSLFGKGGARRVIANSRMVKDEIVRCYKYPADRIDVVYNGVPIDSSVRLEEDRAQTRARLGLAEDDVAVLFAGSGWERKGLNFAIQAVERQERRVRLFVAGRGESRKFKSSKTQFLGVVREMPSLYHASDIFLLPTVYDPFSNACLEALAAGKPVITTRANGFSEIVENGRHATILESAGDVDGISKAIAFWSDAARRTQAHIDNIALAAQFDISRNVSETLAILARLNA